MSAVHGKTFHMLWPFFLGILGQPAQGLVIFRVRYFKIAKCSCDFFTGADTLIQTMPVRYHPRVDTPASGSGLKREPPDDNYEADLMSRTNDRILRKVFSGLLKQ